MQKKMSGKVDMEQDDPAVASTVSGDDDDDCKVVSVGSAAGGMGESSDKHGPMLQLCEASHAVMEQRKAAAAAKAKQEALGAQSSLERRATFKPLQRAQSARSMGDDSHDSTLASTEEGDKGDKSKSWKQTPDKLKGQDLVNYWVAQLSLSAIIAGKKPGVPLHQAELALARLSVKHQTVLKGHMKAVEWCKLPSVNGLASASKEQIFEAIDGLQGMDLQWPCSLQLTLWQKEVEKRIENLMSQVTDASLSEFLETVRSYSLQRDDIGDLEINWRSPKLYQLQVDTQVRASLMVEWCLERALAPLLLEGCNKQPDVHRFCEFVLKEPWAMQGGEGRVLARWQNIDAVNDSER